LYNAFLGEAANTDQKSTKNAQSYLNSKVIVDQKLNASITLKQTSLGALSGRVRCMESVQIIFKRAVASDVDFEIATESKGLVQYAVETAIACKRENGSVTLALQA